MRGFFFVKDELEGLWLSFLSTKPEILPVEQYTDLKETDHWSTDTGLSLVLKWIILCKEATGLSQVSCSSFPSDPEVLDSG